MGTIRSPLAKCAAALTLHTVVTLIESSNTEGVAMQGKWIPFLATSLVMLGCGASYPVPTQPLADTESAERSAIELGAANQPKAQLHLQLAHEQLSRAKDAIRNGENEEATALLSRARSDAELAIALTREEAAKTGAQNATDQSNTQKSTNARQGGQ
jgi:Domain of unknown function (DUF4398)